MTREKLELLQDELIGLQSAANHLGYSMERCQGLIGQEKLPPEELERLESLTSRFARLADLLIQRIFRIIAATALCSGIELLTLDQHLLSVVNSVAKLKRAN